MKRTILLIVNSFLILILLSILVTVAPAQTNENKWTEPVNLSNSGSATSPKIIIDSNQRIHVIWKDLYEGLKYVWNKGDSWSLPLSLDLPFKDSLDSLMMLPDQDGNIHAAWIDSAGNLYYSRVLGQNFALPTNWTKPSLIANNTANFSLSLPPKGTLFVAYIQSIATEKLPAGIYTRSMNRGSLTWSNPRQVKNSPYFRGLDRNTAQVSILAHDNDTLTVAWDESPFERVFLAKSMDGGKSWSEPIEMDRRQPEDGSSQGPSRPVLARQSLPEQAGAGVLLWQAGHQGISCSLYSEGSSQAGQTWSEPQVLPKPFDQNCPDSIQVLGNTKDETWFFAGTPEGFQLFTWQATPEPQGTWSLARLQSGINSFTNPETFRPVILGCQQAAISTGTIYVVGCESGKSGDIWLLSKVLEDKESWFPSPTPPPAWSDPEQLSQANNPFIDLIMLPDAQGRLHAFWSIENQNSIYYALWDTAIWTTPLPILSSLAEPPRVITASLLNSGKTLMLVWSERTSGRLYTSLAPLVQATDANLWTIPQSILPEGETAIDPKCLTAADGTVYISYIKPFNEGRGVYLLHNLNPIEPGMSISLSAPVQVFDAATSGWPSLNDLQISVDNEQKLHLQWIKRGFPPESTAAGLYALHSTLPMNLSSSQDIKWTALEEVTRGEVTWHQIISSPNNILQRAWQERQAGRLTLTHQFSNDAGNSWSQPVLITSNQVEVAQTAMAADLYGNLNIIQIAPDQAGKWQLQNWLWTVEGTWRQQEIQHLPGISSTYANYLAYTSLHRLAILYAATMPIAETSTIEEAYPATSQAERLFAMIRAPQENHSDGATFNTPTPQPSPSKEITDSTTTPLPATSTPTLVPTFSKDAPASSGGIFGEYGLVIAGAIPALLLVILLSIIIFRRFYKYQGE